MKKYILQKMPKAHCPKCTKSVSWLRPVFRDMIDNDETFFICFTCGWIGHIGNGEVLYAKKNE